MTGEITITVTTTLTAADVFRIIIGFSRVWFTCINSAVHYEFPIPSESLHLSDENGVPTIHTEAELEKDPSVSVSCDAYHMSAHQTCCGCESVFVKSGGICAATIIMLVKNANWIMATLGKLRCVI